jgi:hypothetical protein
VRNIYVFTVNKAASMLLYELGKRLARHARMPFWSVNDGTFPEEGLAEDPNAFDGKHGCFCPIRLYTAVPDDAEDGLHDEAPGFVKAARSADDAEDGVCDEAPGFVKAARSAAILHLRDPRDAITSEFYSLAYSHPPVPGKFNPTADMRRQWAEEGVDAHARTHADRWVGRYQIYIDRLLGRPNTTFLKYEQMVTDFPSWLRAFMAPFPIDDADRLHARLARKYRNNFSVKREDVYRQKRQVTPGDHKRKLQPDTIAFLNDKFAAILERLGYEA